MRREFKFSFGEYYHVYNRGVEKRNIFIKDRDWIRFHNLLYLANDTKSFRFPILGNEFFNTIDRGDPIVAVGAYVLMPNHFHILIKEIVQDGISQFMKKLTTGYSMYFNKVNDRVGPLFQNRFKAEHVGNDEYLKYLYAYIHLNPIKLIDPKWKENGIKNYNNSLKFLRQYRYSSYDDYTGINRKEGIILLKKEFPDYFLGMYAFKSFVNDWLAFKGDND